MSATSKKQAFSSEPMKGKSVSDIPGIGTFTGAHLQARGYHSAIDILAKYLTMRGDRDEFRAWLKDTCGASTAQQEDCFTAMQAWCQNNL